MSREKRSDTVNKSKVQPGLDRFVIINLNDRKWREWRLPCQFEAVTQEGAQCEEKKKATTSGPQNRRTHIEDDTHAHTHNRVHKCAYSVCVGACEKRLPPPLREHRKLETIQRLHAGFSSKLFPPQQPASEQAQHPIRPTTYPLGWIFITQGSCSSATQILEFPQEVCLADWTTVSRAG